MMRFAALLLIPAAAAAQPVPVPVPAMEAARAAARAVDQSTQAQRTGQESMDRTAPLLTVEPHPAPAGEPAKKAKKPAAPPPDAQEEPAEPPRR